MKKLSKNLFSWCPAEGRLIFESMPKMSTSTANTIDHVAQPWWKFGHVWMVIAGPAVVVVASFITLYLALSSPNTVLETGSVAQSHAGAGASLAPAMTARNHAATGVVPAKP